MPVLRLPARVLQEIGVTDTQTNDRMPFSLACMLTKASQVH